MRILLEILILFVYANLAEYCIHRWVLHGWLWKQHEPHHASETSTVFFVNSWRGLFRATFLISVSSVIWGLLFGWLPFFFFLIYYFLLLEGAHFLIHKYHMKGHHLDHHAEIKEGNFNVWIPLGDILFKTRI